MIHPVELSCSGSRGAVSMALAVALAIPVGGCTRAGGTADVPDATATTSGLCVGNACRPDPGWGPVDCSQEQGIDTLPIESFDEFPTGTGMLGAQDLYTYTDGTVSAGPGEPALFFQGTAGVPVDGGGFDPLVTPVELCAQPKTYGNNVFHVFGGPFLGWGGGFGIAMSKLNGRDPMSGNRDQNPFADPNALKNLCCPIPGNPGGTCPTDVALPAVCPPAGTEFAVFVGALDVSAYDGVSFWARRGPNGQAGLRVNVGDKYTDDDLNYLAQRQQAATGQAQPLYCQRSRECDCTDHEDCKPFTLPPEDKPAGVSGFFCGQLPAGADLSSVCGAGALSCVGFLESTGNTCCDVTNCNQPYPAYPCDMLPGTGAFADAGGALGDPQFYGRPCTPYAWPTGSSGSYCFNPATDPPPPPSTEVCGDFWMTTVDLGTDWVFYKVPFTNLRQQGFGKKSDLLDLHSVSVVRFTFDVGWVDYWIDSVSFYRQP